MQYESHLPSANFQQTRARVYQWVAQYRLEQSVDGRRKAHVTFIVERVESPQQTKTASTSEPADDTSGSSTPEREEGEIPPSHPPTDDRGDPSPSASPSPPRCTAVGVVSLFQSDVDPAAGGGGGDGDDFFLSYLTFRPHLRRGYATAAVGALLTWAFARLTDLRRQRQHARIFADVDPRNVASLGLLQSKFGFVPVGHRRSSMQVGGEWVDSVYLAVDRTRFESHDGWRKNFLAEHQRLPAVCLEDEEVDHQVRPQEDAPFESTPTPAGHRDVAAAAVCASASPTIEGKLVDPTSSGAADSCATSTWLPLSCWEFLGP